MVIVSSIRKLDMLKRFADSEFADDCWIIVLDENDDRLRAINRKLIPSATFYGIKERKAWLKDWRDVFNIPEKVIPKKAHNELSFGLMLSRGHALQNTIFLDDDCDLLAPSFLRYHLMQLGDKARLHCLRSPKYEVRWVSVGQNFYGRGHPYCQRVPLIDDICYKDGHVVLNQGLWTGIPDMNALDKIIETPIPKYRGYSFSVALDCYTTICSMNLAFDNKIIPAFYQLTQGVCYNRLDDIWSGLFLKKITDHLNDTITTGYPLVDHKQYPRDLFKDYTAEMGSLFKINELLWKDLNEIQLNGKNYTACYLELAIALKKKLKRYDNKIVNEMCDMMQLWARM